MKLKRDEHGHVVVADGNPVYVHDDGKEIPFDAAATVATISRLNGEAKGHREAKETAEGKLKLFDGLDASAARKALETVANLDAKKLIDAGEVEKVKEQAKAAYDQQLQAVEEKYKPVVTERDGLLNQLHSERIGNAFSRSKFIADKLAVPIDMVQAFFGARFKIENDQIVAIGADGNKVFSRANPGSVASFDEALEIMVDAYPNKDALLKGSNGGGGGNGGKGGGDGKTVTRAQFDAMDQTQRMEFTRKGGKIVEAA